MNRFATVALRSAVFWLMAVEPSLMGQSLPGHHLRTVDILPSADMVSRGLLSTSPTKFIRYSVGIDNVNEKNVEILWEGAYLVNGIVDFSLRALQLSTIATAYRPLAVAAEGGIGSTLFVVGWYDRTGEVVVEQWTMGFAAIGQTVGPFGVPHVTLSPPPITKDEIYRGPAMGPVYDAVFHPMTRELLLIADDSALPGYTKNFYSLATDAQQPMPVLRTDLSIGLLPQALGLKLGVTDAGVVYVFVFDVPKWGGYASASFGLPPSILHQTHVLSDADGDGLFELSYQDDAATVLGLGATFSWNHNYTAAGEQ